MNKTKKAGIWLLAILACAMLFAFAACDPGTKEENQLEFEYASFDYGAEDAGPQVTLAPLGGEISYTYEGRDGTVYAAGATAPTDAGKYTVTGTVAETNKYKAVSYSVEYEIRAVAATGVTFPTAAAIEYGQTLADSALSGGQGEGTFAWKTPSTAPNAGKGSYLVVFTPSSTNYLPVEQEVSVTVAPKAITEVAFPSVSGTVTYSSLQTLADLALTGGDTQYGEFSWEVPSTVPTVSGAAAGYTMRLIPSDAVNYDFSGAEGYNAETKRVEKQVAFTMQKAEVTDIIEFPASIAVDYGKTLADAALPQIEGGVFEWDGTVPSGALTLDDAGDYTLWFKPDTVNYDWANYEGGAITEEGTSQQVSVTVNKIAVQPSEFITEAFIGAAQTRTQFARGEVTFADLALPDGYYFADELLGDTVYAGFADTVSVYYNPDKEIYLNTEARQVMVYVESADAVQTASADTLITTDIPEKNLVMKDFEGMGMVAPQNVEYKSKFAANDTVRIYGSVEAGNGVQTLVNFLWKTDFTPDFGDGALGKAANADVRLYITNNATYEKMEFKILNGLTGTKLLKSGATTVISLPSADEYSSFYWAQNGNPSFAMDGSGSFAGQDPSNKKLVVALPFIFWDESADYDLEITVVVDYAVTPYTVSGTALEITNAADVAVEAQLRTDSGDSVDTYQVDIPGNDWNSRKLYLGLDMTLRDLGEKTLTVNSYLWVLGYDYATEDNMAFGFAEKDLRYPKNGMFYADAQSGDAAYWMERLTLENSISNECRLEYDYEGSPYVVYKDGTGYYITVSEARVDLTEEEVLDAKMYLTYRIFGSNFWANVAFTYTLTDPAAEE